MAWPSTPLTAYLAGGLPYIKAADLNSLQSGTNGIVNGTYSLKAFRVDGTGGVVIAPRTGTGRVSAADSGTGGGAANPNLPLTAVALGEYGKGLVPIGWARGNATGELLRGVNVSGDFADAAATLKVAATNGTYTMTFNSSPADTTNACAIATSANSTTWASAVTGAVGGKIAVTVYVVDAAGALADGAWQVVVFAE